MDNVLQSITSVTIYIYWNEGAPTNEIVTFTPDTQIQPPSLPPARADQPKMFT
jgi:hypothetical protein